MTSVVLDYQIPETGTVVEKLVFDCISNSKWQVTKKEDDCIQIYEGKKLTGFPVTLRICILPYDRNNTKIKYKASSRGIGPIEKSLLRKSITRFHSQIIEDLETRTELKLDGLVCPSCGEILAPGTKFCPVDGTQILKECLNCQHYNKPSFKFCENCGSTL